MPERDLPRVAGQQVQAERADRRDPRVVEHGEPERALHEDGDERVEQEDREQPELGVRRAEEPEVVAVLARHEAVGPGPHMRRTSFVPNRP